MLYLPPLSTLGALHPFLQSIAFLLLHGACERLAGEGLIIILFIDSLICFVPILNALLLTASGNTYDSSTACQWQGLNTAAFMSMAATWRPIGQSRGFCWLKEHGFPNTWMIPAHMMQHIGTLQRCMLALQSLQGSPAHQGHHLLPLKAS